MAALSRDLALSRAELSAQRDQHSALEVSDHHRIGLAVTLSHTARAVPVSCWPEREKQLWC